MGDIVKMSLFGGARMIYLVESEHDKQNPALTTPRSDGEPRAIFTRREWVEVLRAAKGIDDLDARRRYVDFVVDAKVVLGGKVERTAPRGELSSGESIEVVEIPKAKPKDAPVAAELTQKQARVLEIVERYPGESARALADRVGDRDLRTIGRRLSELEAVGRVARGRAVKCAVTKRQVATWLPVSELGQMALGRLNA